ncbi:MAG: ABC transporter substrate-binding protein [Rhodoferax sp.]
MTARLRLAYIPGMATSISNHHTTRRHWLAAVAAGAILAPLASQAQRPARRLRMLLNTGFSSPQAWLWLAQARGYLAGQGIELELTPGGGAYTAAPRMIEGSFDLAYGDVNSLIEECARRPQAAPRGIYMMFNASPSCVLVAADGPIQHPRQLLGQRLIGHDSDVALRTFGALCRHQGLEPGAMQIASAWSGMAGMAEEVLSGRAAGAFGYVSTFTGALVQADPALLRRVRFLRYADFAPDLYGSVIMASTRLLREEPELVTRLVQALNRGVADMLLDPEAGLAAVVAAAPGLPLEAERARLRATLDLEMNRALPAGARQGFVGDVDTARLARSIELMVKGIGLPRTPAVAEVFTQVHLPPAAARLPLAMPTKPYRLLLNTSLSGPVAFFLLAQDRGYLRREGLELQLSGGPGAAAMVPLVRDGAYDFGYGDISALIERIAHSAPGTGPIAVFTTFNAVPFTIAVDAKGPIRQPSDLLGKRVIGHASDAALLTFDLYAQAAGIDAARVRVDGSMGSMGQAVKDMLQGQGADGVFGFVNTLIASASPLGVDPGALRFLNWSDVLPEMYGNTLFVTREAYQRDRQGVQGLVTAVNRGLVDAVQSPQAAIDALLRHAPGSDRAVNLRRLQGTFDIEMAHPECRRIGIGDMDGQRLQRLIERLVRVKRLPRTPSVDEVFDRSFLPPLEQRVRNLVR